MKKVIVIGCPGAGKSTFARKLRDKTGLPLYYLDMLWHKPDRTNVTREQFDTALSNIMENDEWIIDGNYIRTLEMRIRACDTVFFLDFPVDVCLSGARERIGKKREDMPWIEDKFDEEFEKWILDFNTDQRPKILELLEEYKEQKSIIIYSTREELTS
ncbi:MAG: adenylate kinase [Lachnospiraceae bacterium]|nr:adenylate kinase [Lachnospiraceae bacterium]